MLYVVYGIFFLSCFVLVAAVLLQPGKTDAGALFTSNVSSAAFGPRGTATVLSKITIAAASVFMISALFLSMPALSGGGSVLTTVPEADGTVPAAAEQAQPDVNAAVPGTAPDEAQGTEQPADAALAPADNAAPANTAAPAEAPANTAANQ